jgi:hypothetical protein
VRLASRLSLPFSHAVTALTWLSLIRSVFARLIAWSFT